MGGAPSPEILNDYAKRLIRIKARQLIGRAGLRACDREDIEQELTLRLLEQAQRFDPARGSLHTFVARVLDSAAAMLLRHRRRLKRAAGYRAASLEAAGDRGDTEPHCLRDVLSEADLRRHTGTPPSDALDGLERTEALDHVLRRMPPRLRDVCRRLAASNASAVARQMGISRRQLRKLVAEVRRYFEDAGLGNP